MAFEAMRLHVDRSGKQPKAFLLTCGNLAMARARPVLVQLLRLRRNPRAGQHLLQVDRGGRKAALESKARSWWSAPDDDYAEAAPKVKELLAAKPFLVVARRSACAAQGITNFISVKANVLETLKFYLKEMGI